MRIKRFLCILTALVIASVCLSVSAEDVQETTEALPTTLEIAMGRPTSSEPTHITVGNSSAVSGAFFTDQFGVNTSDLDVRAMLHGYNPIVWDSQLDYVPDEQVVSNLSKGTDGKGNAVYKVELQKDLTWNDGTPITAADYAFAYALLISDEFCGLGTDAQEWVYLYGAEEYTSGESDVLAGIRLLDEYSYTVTVGKEYLPYFYEYSYLFIEPAPISVIAPGCVVDDNGEGIFIRNEDETVEKPVFTTALLKKTILDQNTGYLSNPKLTCGPYKLVSYDRKTGTVEFSINRYYKGNYEGVKPVITDITLKQVYPEDVPAALENGEIDLINKVVNGETVLACRQLVTDAEEQGFGQSNYARLGYGFIGLACDRGPQQYTAVRQAIAYAIDADSFVRDYLKGLGLPVYAYYGIGQWMAQVAMGNLRPNDLTPEDEAIWDSFSLDGLETYALDVQKAQQLLIDDGWTLNGSGDPFDPETDAVRYKQTDAGLMALTFKFALTENNEAANEVLEMLRTSMEPMGAQFVVTTLPYIKVVEDYTHVNGTRVYDMCFLAYNFVSIFDPLTEFSLTDGKAANQNYSGIADEKLSQLTIDLHNTEPGDLKGYEQKWIEFQTRYNEILPSVPIYSNVYFDFYSDHLQNYVPEVVPNWPTAILYAYWAEPEIATNEAAAEDELEIEEDGTEDIEIGD